MSTRILGADFNPCSDLNTRIEKGWKALWGAKNRVDNLRNLPRKVKCVIIVALVRQVLLFGSVARAYSASDVRQLAAVEKRCIRWAFSTNRFKMAYNHTSDIELYRRLRLHPLEVEIRTRKARFLGHTLRHSNNPTYGALFGRFLPSMGDGVDVSEYFRANELPAVNILSQYMEVLKCMGLEREHLRAFTNLADSPARFDRSTWSRLQRAAYCIDATQGLCPTDPKNRKKLWEDLTINYPIKCPPGLEFVWDGRYLKVVALPDENNPVHKCRRKWIGKPKEDFPATIGATNTSVFLDNVVLGMRRGADFIPVSSFGATYSEGSLVGQRLTLRKTVAQNIYSHFLSKQGLNRTAEDEVQRFKTVYAQEAQETLSVSSGFGGDLEAARVIRQKKFEIEALTHLKAKKMPFIKGVSRKVFKKRVGRPRSTNTTLYTYRFWCLLCSLDEFETLPDENAEQIIDHAKSHGHELITIWKRRSDGALFSDHFLKEQRRGRSFPWNAPGGAFDFVENIVPECNLISPAASLLRCKNEKCDHVVNLKNGVQTNRARAAFYGALRNHESICEEDPICIVINPEA